VLPDDMVRLGGQWDALARESFFLIPTVPQPLWDVIEDRATVEAALADPNRLRGIHHHYRRARIAA
jgi:hypothetical protein